MDNRRVERMRSNAALPDYAEAVSALRKEADEGARIPYRIGAEEFGQWTHYYHCHADGSRLEFDWREPGAHRCPECGKLQAGEPYNSAWTSIANNLIGRAVYSNGLLFALEEKEESFHTARDFLLSYAEHYAGYPIHGDIPYNGPGKLYAQTLDEAHWILDLAVGFDLIQAHLPREERERIGSGLFQTCARFLILHKEKQIHNHAVLITSAIAAIGLVLKDDKLLRSGLNGEYGLLDQLSRGLLEDGLWYEGNVQYHFYAFSALLHYALLAEGTPWELWTHPAMKRMLDYPLPFIGPDGRMPTWNDAGLGHDIGTYAPYYEIGLDRYGDEKYRALLHTAYGTAWADPGIQGHRPVRRDSVYALLYGTELRPLSGNQRILSEAAYAVRCFPASGVTKLVNEHGWQVILRHSTFGGEHDHMDRLGFSAMCHEVPLLTDPGTTSYGVPAHYGWFKHTFSHNTISIGGADQPPRDGHLVQLVETSWGVWAETAVDWLGDDYRMKGSILLPPELCPWDTDMYQGVQVRRIIMLAKDHMLDAVLVHVPEPKEVYLMNHVSGSLITLEGEAWEKTDEKLGLLDQSWLQDKQRLASGSKPELRYSMGKGRMTQVFWCSQPSEVFSALTPNNPPSASRTSLFQRVRAEGSVMFLQALAYDGGDVGGELEVTELQANEAKVKLTIGGSSHRYTVSWNQEKAWVDYIET
jgi:hypothetical protein